MLALPLAFPGLSNSIELLRHALGVEQADQPRVEIGLGAVDAPTAVGAGFDEDQPNVGRLGGGGPGVGLESAGAADADDVRDSGLLDVLPDVLPQLLQRHGRAGFPTVQEGSRRGENRADGDAAGPLEEEPPAFEPADGEAATVGHPGQQFAVVDSPVGHDGTDLFSPVVVFPAEGLPRQKERSDRGQVHLNTGQERRFRVLGLFRC